MSIASRDRVERALQTTRELPDAVDAQQAGIEPAGIGDGEALVDAVPLLAALLVAGVERSKRLVLRRRARQLRCRRAQRLRVDAGLDQLAQQALQGSRKAGGVGDGLEVPRRRTSDLAREDASGQRRHRPATLRRKRRLAERERELAGRDDRHVGVPAEQGRETPLKVGPQQGAADEDRDRRERIGLLCRGDRVGERPLEDRQRCAGHAGGRHQAARSSTGGAGRQHCRFSERAIHEITNESHVQVVVGHT